MQAGPKMYIPANTHPHLGKRFVDIQLATPIKIKLTNETAFSQTSFTV